MASALGMNASAALVGKGKIVSQHPVLQIAMGMGNAKMAFVNVTMDTLKLIVKVNPAPMIAVAMAFVIPRKASVYAPIPGMEKVATSLVAPTIAMAMGRAWRILHVHVKILTLV